MCPDWSSVPTIQDIASRLHGDADYLHFRAVCSSWRSNSPNRPPSPWLHLVVEQESHSLGFCKFPDPQISPSKLPRRILRNRYLCGSSRGWIALLNSTPGISLHNLVTGDRIKLPILIFDQEGLNGTRVKKDYGGFAYYKSGQTHYSAIEPFSIIYTLLADKLVLSSDPSGEDCVIMALRYEGEKLIYCRPRDGNSWNILSLPCTPHCLTDIVFYNGQFYGVFEYRVFVCKTGPGESGVTEILPATPLFSDGRARGDYFPMLNSFLVVSSQGLLLVAISKPSEYYKITNYICEVFRVDFVHGMLSLVKLESLGGRSLFLGPESTSLCAANAPGCTPNCIYFVHRPHLERGKGDRVSVFNMEDGSTSCITSFSDVYSRVHWITSHLA